MKTRNLKIRSTLLTLSMPAVAILAMMHIGCASTQDMQSGAGVPASQGTVKVKEGDNGNTQLSIRVKHLAAPEKVVKGTSVYVVWILPKGSTKQNVGALVLDDDLEGRLETVTPHKQFKLLVTPEVSGLVAAPANAAVFTYTVDRT